MLQNYSNRKFPPNFICILCDEATGEGSETQYGGKYGSAGEACGSHAYYEQERIDRLYVEQIETDVHEYEVTQVDAECQFLRVCPCCRNCPRSQAEGQTAADMAETVSRPRYAAPRAVCCVTLRGAMVI